MERLSRVVVFLIVGVIGLSATEINLNAMPGFKVLENGDWEPLDQQGMLAVQFDVRRLAGGDRGQCGGIERL